MSEISDRILALIAKKELSYGTLSEITKIPKSALQRYATGETEKIPTDRLEIIANALNTSVEYLLGKTECWYKKGTIGYKTWNNNYENGRWENRNTEIIRCKIHSETKQMVEDIADELGLSTDEAIDQLLFDAAQAWIEEKENEKLAQETNGWK